MRQEEKTAAARALLDNPLFHILMDEIEANAVNACVTAAPTDHDARAAGAAEVRAIRTLRRKLNHLTAEANAGANPAPA